MMEFTLSAKKTYEFNRWKLTPTLVAKNFIIENENVFLDERLDKNQFFLSPSLTVYYHLASNSRVFLNLNYNEVAPESQNLFNDWIMQSHRFFKRNQPNLAFRKSLMSSLGYTYYNLRRQEKFVLAFGASKNTNIHSSRNFINENFVLMENFMLSENSLSYSTHLELEKYLHFLRSTFTLSGSYFISEFKNTVNDSELRLNQSHYLSTEFNIKTAFNLPINLQNNLKWNKTTFKTEDDFINYNNLISNNFKLIFNKQQWNANLGFDYYFSDLQNNQPIYFLDSEIKFRPKNKSWAISMIGNNLLNMKNFETSFISDYYFIQTRQTLNTTYLVLKVDFRL